MLVKKVFLISAGSLALFLGVLGIFLPVLPTTPFLLLSAACYMRSSERLYKWLIHHKVLGLYIRSYIEHRAVTVKAKVISISMLWLAILSSVIFFISLLWLRILLLLIACGVTLYLLSLKTLTEEERGRSIGPFQIKPTDVH